MGKGKIDEAIGQFRYEGVLIDERPYGSGHINDTYLLTFEIAEEHFQKTDRTYGEYPERDFLSAQEDY